jgi:L-rhamnose mutarotase
MANLWTFGDSFTAGHGCKYQENTNFSDNDNNVYHNMYKDYIDLNKKIWPELLSEFLNLELINLGKNGSSNEWIADNIITNIKNISKNDIVILQTSMFGRYDFPFKKEKSLMGNGPRKNEHIKDYIIKTNESPYFFKTIFITNINKEWNNSMKNILNYINGQECLNDKEVILDEYKYNLIRGFFSEFISTEKYYERSVWRIMELSKVLSLIGIKNYIINETHWPRHLDKPNNLVEMHDGGIHSYIYANKQTIKQATNGKIDDTHPSYEGHESIADYILKFIQNDIK